MLSTVQSTHRGGVYDIYSTLNTQGWSLCHLQYTESMPSTVHSTHRGGVYAIYSTLSTQGRSLCHLQYNQHTGVASMPSTEHSTQGVESMPSTIRYRQIGRVYVIYSTLKTQWRSIMYYTKGGQHYRLLHKLLPKYHYKSFSAEYL
jgi:hypothetical protein